MVFKVTFTEVFDSLLFFTASGSITGFLTIPITSFSFLEML